MLIVTGTNGSGKSTYLRQLALIQIMAQIGCYVPAKFAKLRMVDQVFAVFAQDSLTTSSSFLQEMFEVASVIKV